MIANDPGFLRLVLPDEALGAWTREALNAAGLSLSQRLPGGRDFVLDDDPLIVDWLGFGLASLTVHEADIPVYVEHGVADLGVARQHVLRERDARVYRPFTFSFEAGVMALVAPEGTELGKLVERPHLRVATPWRHTAQDFFASRGWNVELIALTQEVELAPLLGLADAVLMAVEDELALTRQGLAIVEPIAPCRAKLLANRATGRERLAQIARLVDLLNLARPVRPTGA